MRPQYGSSPYHEHLHRALAADPSGTRLVRRRRWPPRVTVSFTTFVAPSASSAICRARSAQAAATAGAEVGRVGPSGRAAGHQDHGVVRRRAPVGDERVEAVGDSDSQRPLQLVGLGRRVGGQHGEHRGHARGEHGRAFGHPADGDVAPPDDGLLATGVGGADRLRRAPPPSGRARRPRAGGCRRGSCRSAGRTRSDRWSRPAPGRPRTRARRPSPAHIRRASSSPRSPVAAFALPLFRIVAAARPPLDRQVVAAT